MTYRNAPCDWKIDSTAPTLSRDCVDVWRRRIEGDSIERERSLLSSDELAAADRFHFEQKRIEYAVGRALMRRTLGHLLSVDPRRLEFEVGPHGKPSLAGKWKSATNVAFNLSHSHDWAVLAVAADRQIGIDVERHRPNVAFERMARRFFSPAESATLLALEPPQRQAAFFRCWTRKEAIIKATGRGMTLGLDRFDVTLLADESPELRRAEWDPMIVRNWQLADVTIAPDYSAAVAVSGDEPFTLRCWNAISDE